MTDTLSNTYDQIIQAATACFAEKGYHGSSVREIAHKVGVSVSTLYYHVESKDNLYLLVFQRQYQEENEIISSIIAGASESVVRDPQALRSLLYRVMDALIDRSVENPQIVNLWTRRWLEKPREPDGIEEFYSLPLYEMIANLLNQAKAAGIIDPVCSDINLVIHSFTWLNYGFFGFGQLSYRARVGDPLHPQQIDSFRAYVRVYVDEMLCFSIK